MKQRFTFCCLIYVRQDYILTFILLIMKMINILTFIMLFGWYARNHPWWSDEDFMAFRFLASLSDLRKFCIYILWSKQGGPIPHLVFALALLFYLKYHIYMIKHSLIFWGDFQTNIVSQCFVSKRHLMYPKSLKAKLYYCFLDKKNNKKQTKILQTK